MTPKRQPVNAGTPAAAKPADAEPVATDPVAPDQLASDGNAVRAGLPEDAAGSK